MNRQPLPLLLFIYLLFRPHLQHMEVPWLGVKLELQLPAYTTAMQDLTSVYDWISCGLGHSCSSDSFSGLETSI